MKYFTGLLLIFFCLSSFGQEKTEKQRKEQRISVGVYQTKAMGRFGSVDEEDYRAGFAKSGAAMSISYQILLTNNSNILFSFIRSNYEFDAVGFEDVVDFDENWINRSIYGDDFRVNSITFGYKFSGGTKMVKGFVNPFFGFSRMVAGRIEVAATYKTDQTRLVMSQTESEPDGELCYGINGGVEFYVTKWLNVNFEMGFIGSAFDIEADFNATASSQDFIELFPDYRLPYSAFNVGGSLGVTF